MIVLARHGQSVANAEGRLVGRADSPLTDLGRLQAARTGEWLAQAARPPGGPPAMLLCSPLSRTRGTAGAIADAYRAELGQSPEVLVDDRLVELDYGALDLQELGTVPAGTWSAWRSDPAYRPPGGETLLELASRVQALLEEVAPVATDREVVAVTHVSPIKAAAAWALGVGVEVSWRLSLPVAAISRISIGRTGPALLSFGETAHLGAG